MITDDVRRGCLTTETTLLMFLQGKISYSCDYCLGEKVSQVKCI